MNFSGGSATGIAGSVWTNTTRTLTGFGGGALSFPAVTRTAIATSSSVNLQPAAGSAILYTIATAAGATGSLTIQLNDNTNTINVLTVPAGNQNGSQLPVNNTVFLRINNTDPTNQAFYMAAGIRLTQ